MPGRHSSRASSLSLLSNSQRSIRTKSRSAARRISAAIEPLEQRRLLSLTVPALNSHPGAAQSLYLDFDGSPSFVWSSEQGIFFVRGPNSSINSPAPVQAFSQDADFNNFSATELTTINHIWQWVSEKYSPFTINVTTVNPGFVQDSRTMTCLIAGSKNDWLNQNAGGFSDIDGFEDGGENTCFAFSADVVNNGYTGTQLEQFLGETVAHEAGHEVGLKHQRTPGSEYYFGDSTRAPIMGGSSINTTGARGIWWQTNNWAGQNSGDLAQFDLETLTASSPDRLQYYFDADGSNLSFNSAGKLNTVAGLINNIFDVDSYPFDATGTRGTFNVKNWQYGGMLAPTVKIRISSTNTYVSGITTIGNTSASIDTNNLVPGQHYILEVGSQGQYGDVGQFTIDGSQTVFAGYDAASRTVNVGGFAGNNNIHMFVSANVLTIQDSVNGGPTASQTFTASAVDSININLGAGDDVVNWDGVFKVTGVEIPVYTSLGGGFDTLKLGNSSSFENFTVNSIVIDGTFGAHHGTIWNFDADKLELDGGSSSENDTFNINSQNSYSTIWIYGGLGDDSLYLSPQVVGSSNPVVIFHGEGGADSATIDGSTLTQQQSFIFFNNTLQRYIPGDPFAKETQFDAAVERVTVRGGAADDSFYILSEVSGQFISAQGYGGDDKFVMGASNINFPPVFQHPYSANIFGTVQVLGATGNDSLTIDDLAYNLGASPSITISSTSFSSNLFGAISNINWDSGLDSFEFDASNSRAGPVTLLGVPATPSIKLLGGTGTFDVLTVDDRSLATIPFRVDLGADSYREYYGTPASPTIREPVLSGFEQFKVLTSNFTNTINVLSTRAGQSMSLTTGSGADTITLYPRDDAANLTMNGDLFATTGGGSDKIIVDDSASTTPISYRFVTSLLGTVDGIAGLGTATVSLDAENVTIKAGAGDDTFSFDKHKQGTGLAIYGGDGNDMLDFGADNFAANISPNMTSFLFDGQGGYDTENFRNANNSDSWVYGMSSASETISQQSASSSYIINLADASVEQKTVFAGQIGDTFQAFGVDAGQTLDLHGAGGDDALSLVSNPKFISGRINFFAEDGANNRILQISNSDTADSTLHIYGHVVGARSDDTFFGPGGSIYYDSLGAITLRMGSGADTAYIAPDSTATINITGGSPTAAPGDTINLALADAQNYVLNGTGVSGSVTSDNLKTVSYSGFEAGPNVDDAAPAIVAADINLDGIPDGAALRGSRSGTRTRAPVRRQALDVSFSEDVSALLSPASIELTNLTTGEIIPTANIALQYDTITNTAHFTFPGYVNGVLPDGNYHGRILAGLPDSFGNALPADAPFDFFFLGGDANHDRVVDVSDLGILATNWQSSGRIFSEGDFNYDGVVDVSDLGILATNWQQSLPAPVAPSTPARKPKLQKVIALADALNLVGLKRALPSVAETGRVVRLVTASSADAGD